MKKLTCTDFSAQLNTRFTARIDEGDPDDGEDPVDVELELVEAKDRTNDQCERFSLIFQGPGDRMVDQGCYALNHDTMGENQIFLVPIGKDEEKGYRYEAVFNRLKEE